MSSTWSATIRFSRAFSASSSRSRLASDASMPPYFFRQAQNVAVLIPWRRQSSSALAPASPRAPRAASYTTTGDTAGMFTAKVF